MEETQNSISQAAVFGVLATTAIVIFAISYLSNLLGFIKSFFASPQAEVEAKVTDDFPEKQASGINSVKSQKGHFEGRGKEASKTKFSHQWLAASLKAHTGDISGMSFSSNGKYLVSCADDRTIYLWYLKEYLSNSSKFLRVNVLYDHATRICFSPDNKAFLATLYSAGTVRVYKIQKKNEGSSEKIEAGFDFPEKDSDEVLCLGISINGFIMTCYRKNTVIKIWDLKGNMLDSFNSNQVHHNQGAVSPCGRFVACSGFTPEVKVWEVSFSKGGEFKEVVKAFQLGGHKSSVYSFAFNADSSRVATVANDGTWKLWDTNVDYKNRQDPKLIRTWSCDHLTGSSLIALSPNGLSVAIANGSHVYMYSVHEEEYEKIADVHAGGATAMEFSSNNLLLGSAGQKSIHLFHNVKGVRALNEDLRQKFKAAGSNAGMKGRIVEQIKSNEELLKKMIHPCQSSKSL